MSSDQPELVDLHLTAPKNLTPPLIKNFSSQSIFDISQPLSADPIPLSQTSSQKLESKPKKKAKPRSNATISPSSLKKKSNHTNVLSQKALLSSTKKATRLPKTTPPSFGSSSLSMPSIFDNPPQPKTKILSSELPILNNHTLSISNFQKLLLDFDTPSSDLVSSQNIDLITKYLKSKNYKNTLLSQFKRSASIKFGPFNFTKRALEFKSLKAFTYALVQNVYPAIMPIVQSLSALYLYYIKELYLLTLAFENSESPISFEDQPGFIDLVQLENDFILPKYLKPSDTGLANSISFLALNQSPLHSNAITSKIKQTENILIQIILLFQVVFSSAAMSTTCDSIVEITTSFNSVLHIFSLSIFPNKFYSLLPSAIDFTATSFLSAFTKISSIYYSHYGIEEIELSTKNFLIKSLQEVASNSISSSLAENILTSFYNVGSLWSYFDPFGQTFFSNLFFYLNILSNNPDSVSITGKISQPFYLNAGIFIAIASSSFQSQDDPVFQTTYLKRKEMLLTLNSKIVLPRGFDSKILQDKNKAALVTIVTQIANIIIDIGEKSSDPDWVSLEIEMLVALTHICWESHPDLFLQFLSKISHSKLFSRLAPEFYSQKKLLISLDTVISSNLAKPQLLQDQKFLLGILKLYSSMDNLIGIYPEFSSKSGIWSAINVTNNIFLTINLESHQPLLELLQSELSTFSKTLTKEEISVFFLNVLKSPDAKLRYYIDYIQYKLFFTSKLLIALNYPHLEEFYHYLYCIVVGLEHLVSFDKSDLNLYVSGTWLAIPSILITCLLQKTIKTTSTFLHTILLCINSILPHLSLVSTDARYIWVSLLEKVLVLANEYNIIDQNIDILISNIINKLVSVTLADSDYNIRIKTIQVFALIDLVAIENYNIILSQVRLRLSDENPLVSTLAEKFIQDFYLVFSAFILPKNSENTKVAKFVLPQEQQTSCNNNILYYLLRYLCYGISEEIIPPILSSKSESLLVEERHFINLIQELSSEPVNFYDCFSKAISLAIAPFIKKKNHANLSIPLFNLRTKFIINSTDFVTLLNNLLSELTKNKQLTQTSVFLEFITSLKEVLISNEEFSNWFASKTFDLAKAYFLVGMFDSAFVYLHSHMDQVILATNTNINSILSFDNLKQIVLLACQLKSTLMNNLLEKQLFYICSADLALFARVYVSKLSKTVSKNLFKSAEFKTLSDFIVNYTDINIFSLHKTPIVYNDLADLDFINCINFDLERNNIDSEIAQKCLDLLDSDVSYDTCLKKLQNFDEFESTGTKIYENFSLVCDNNKNQENFISKLLLNPNTPEPVVRSCFEPQYNNHLNQLLLSPNSSFDRVLTFCTPEFTFGFYVYALLNKIKYFYANQPNYKLQNVLNSVIAKNSNNSEICCSMASDTLIAYLESDTKLFSDLFPENTWFNSYYKLEACQILIEDCIINKNFELQHKLSSTITGTNINSDLQNATLFLQTAQFSNNPLAKKIQNFLNQTNIAETELGQEFFDKNAARSAIIYNNLLYYLVKHKGSIVLQNHINLANTHSSYFIDRFLPSRLFEIVCTDDINIKEFGGSWMRYLYPMLSQLVCGLFYHNKQVRENCYSVLLYFIKINNIDTVIIQIIGRYLEIKNNIYLEKLVKCIRKISPKMILALENFCIQSKSLLTFLHEQVYDILVLLKEKINSLFSQKQIQYQKLELFLRPLKLTLNKKPLSHEDVKFLELYRSTIQNAMDFISQNITKFATASELWNHKESFGNIQRYLKLINKPSFDFKEAGLKMTCEQTVPIPLPMRSLSVIYSQSSEETDVFYIENIDSKVDILSQSKTKPRVINALTRVGDDFKKMKYILKGGEDLNSDLKIMKMWQTIKQSNGNLGFLTFGVAPVGYTFGFIEFVEGVESLYTIYKNHIIDSSSKDLQKKSVKSSYINPIKLYEDFAANNSNRAEVHKLLSNYMPSNLVYKQLSSNSASAYSFLVAQQNFIKSLATTSVLCYLAGLGDRHLDNIMLNSKTGYLLNVDLNLNFDRGLMLNFPETVPFRLTNNLQYFVGNPSSCTRFESISNGMVFLESMTRTLISSKMIKEQIVYGIMSGFILDPPLEWHQYGRTNKIENDYLVKPSSLTQETAILYKSASAPPKNFSQPQVVNIIDFTRSKNKKKFNFHDYQNYNLELFRYCKKLLNANKHINIRQTGLVPAQKTSFNPVILTTDIYKFANHYTNNDSNLSHNCITKPLKNSRYIRAAELFDTNNSVYGARLIAINAQNTLIAKLSAAEIKQYDINRYCSAKNESGEFPDDYTKYILNPDNKYIKDKMDSRKQCLNMWIIATDVNKLSNMFEGWAPWV
ncbi:hypothetical protein BB561_004495 [Smittium simulii]|uniref:PI3K/PI4K catalytic domain-containing protein n=1 Tax=Smittium simulii TaxID=133385 RepID=A0A2T9YG10_9FUNG|nr:hypothetical protein BB561_004495 [Smittium simulii]